MNDAEAITPDAAAKAIRRQADYWEFRDPSMRNEFHRIADLIESQAARIAELEAENARLWTELVDFYRKTPDR